MSRCAECNGLGFDVVPVEDVQRRGEVKEKVLSRVQEFYACKQCSKLYWEGPKYDTACQQFGKLLHDTAGEAESSTAAEVLGEESYHGILDNFFLAVHGEDGDPHLGSEMAPNSVQGSTGMIRLAEEGAAEDPGSP